MSEQAAWKDGVDQVKSGMREAGAGLKAAAAGAAEAAAGVRETVAASPLAPHETDFGTDPSTIEAHIRQAREEVAATVDELVERMRPANQAKALKDKGLGLVDAARDTVADAIAGDAEARKKVGIAAGAVAGLALLALRRRR